MSLIIYSKTQQVSPERFGVSVVVGALILLMLGGLYGRLHHMSHMWPQDMVIDVPMVVFAMVVAAVIGFIYFRQAKSQRSIDSIDSATEEFDEEIVVDNFLQSQAQRVLQLIPLGNAALFVVGLYVLVWVPVQTNFDMVSQLGLIALYIIVFFLPLNYAGRLQVESYLDLLDVPTRTVLWQRYRSILYWVLVCYWGALFAAYVTLLLHSNVYCRPWFGC